jgi:putative hydrolase of the HAD superfamily
MQSASGEFFDWDHVDTVLLDMDGTVLDLKFDNFFWHTVVPQCYSEMHGIALTEAHQVLIPRFAEKEGTLQWYCLDHWTRELGIDIARLKEETGEHVDYLPGTPEYLQAIRAAGKRLVLVTNAHRDSLSVKLRRTDLAEHLDAIHSAHDLGVPKEDHEFWARLRAREPFDPKRTVLIDDSIAVLSSARSFGIKKLIAIRKPDSTRPARAVTDFWSVETLPDLGAPPQANSGDSLLNSHRFGSMRIK